MLLRNYWPKCIYDSFFILMPEFIELFCLTHAMLEEILYRRTYNFLKLLMQNNYNYSLNGTMVNKMIDQLAGQAI